MVLEMHPIVRFSNRRLGTDEAVGAAALSHPIALDYDSTLVLAIELSNTSWVLAGQVPRLQRVEARQSIEPTAEALLAHDHRLGFVDLEVRARSC